MTSYDQHLVDKSIEQRILQGLQSVPRKTSKVSNDYLDIDLIRGTPFKKAKPSLNWASFLKKGFCRSIFMPYYFQWWKQHTSTRFACALILVYVLILLQIGLYLSIADNSVRIWSQVSVASERCVSAAMLCNSHWLYGSSLFSNLANFHQRNRTT